MAFDAAGINIPYPQRDTHLYLYDQDGQRTSLPAPAPVQTLPESQRDAAA